MSPTAPAMTAVTVTVEHAIPTAVPVSPRVLRVAAMFGLGVDEQHALAVVPRMQLTLRPHQVVFVTGPSGSGKSTLLRLLADELVRHPSVRVIDFARLPPLPDAALVDALHAPMPADHADEDDRLEHTLRLLSLAGLNDAFVMLRSPRQLSDGQRYRLRLAQAMAAASVAEDEPRMMERSDGEEAHHGPATDHPSAVCHPPSAIAPPAARLSVVLADEFGATLDRVTAAVIAANVRKWTRREPVCFLAATTHDDLLEPLEPDCVIEQHLGGTLAIAQRRPERIE